MRSTRKRTSSDIVLVNWLHGYRSGGRRYVPHSHCELSTQRSQMNGYRLSSDSGTKIFLARQVARFCQSYVFALEG